jgi:hypothetical protein
MVLQLWRGNKVPCLRGVDLGAQGHLRYIRTVISNTQTGHRRYFAVRPAQGHHDVENGWRNSAVQERDLARELENLSLAPYRGLTLEVALHLPDEPNGGSEKTEGAASLLSRRTLRGQAQRGVN